MKNFLHKKELEGFTLMELLVATAIFVVVAVGGLSALLSSQRVYKRISSNRVAVDNINMLVDTMTREMKFGTKYGCVNDSTQGSFNRVSNTKYSTLYETDLVNNTNGTCDAVAYTPQGTSTVKVVYYYNQASSTVNQVSYDRAGFGSVYNKRNFSDVALTSSGFIIDKFWFTVNGINSEDYIQPRVGVYVSGVVDVSKGAQGETISTTTLFLQSSITGRSLDN